MRLIKLSRFFMVLGICAALAAAASNAFAQTQQLNKTLERKFPEDFCPIDTNFLGTFVTNTGIIQLTFQTSADDDGADLKSGTAVAFSQILDDISIIEAAEFADPAKTVENTQGCYFDGPPFVPVYIGDLLNNPKVPFYEPFDPPSSECPWDETDGATISGGLLHFDGTGGTDGIITTSVIISGLTPGTPYVLHGRWSANDFQLPNACVPPAACLQVTIDDVPVGCAPLPVRESTWGGVKALYKN